MLFTDANYWISLFSEKEENHERAVVLESQTAHERLVLSEHALSEVFTIISRHYGRSLAFTSCGSLLTEPRVEVMQADYEDWKEAIKIGLNYDVSFTDAITVVLMRSNNVKKIVSFDSDFNKFKGIQVVC